MTLSGLRGRALSRSRHTARSRKTADLVVTLTRAQLLAMLAGGSTDGVQFDGDPKALATITAFTEHPDPGFAIVSA